MRSDEFYPPVIPVDSGTILLMNELKRISYHSHSLKPLIEGAIAPSICNKIKAMTQRRNPITIAFARQPEPTLLEQVFYLAQRQRQSSALNFWDGSAIADRGNCQSKL